MSSASSFRPVIIGQFSPPVLACLRSWGEQGWEPGFIDLRKKRSPAPASRFLGGSFRLDPHLLFTNEGITVIRRFLGAFKADGLLCIQEKLGMWLDRNRQAFNGFTLWVPSAETTKRILSKRVQIEVARSVDLSVLPSYFIDRAGMDALQKVPENHFPLCLRPSGEGGVVPRFKVRLANTREEAHAFILGLHRMDKPLIAQPFRNLPNLVVHGSRSVEGRTFGMQGFLVERKFEGLTLTIRPVGIEKELRQQCVEFTRELGVVGNYHFEFLYDPHTKEAYFLEINARLGGTTAKVLACGYDEPVLALQAFGARAKTARNRGVQKMSATSRLALGKYIYHTVTNRVTPLDYPIESKWRRISKALRAMACYRDDVISFRDLKGTRAFYFQALCSKFIPSNPNIAYQ